MPRHEPVPLEEVDLADIDGFADLRGFAQLDTLRAEDPVHWNPESGGNAGFWAVTRYADIWEVDKDPETFTSEKFVNIEEVDDDLMEFRRSILETDGARHLALRRLMQREFTPRNLMKNYEAFLRELTKSTVDALSRRRADNGGEIDFVKLISADFPINVLARLLDVPHGDDRSTDRLGQRAGRQHRPRLRQGARRPRRVRRVPPPAVPVAHGAGGVGLRPGAARQARVGGDGTDLVSILANKMPDDERAAVASRTSTTTSPCW